jgi:hypothetical protein
MSDPAHDEQDRLADEWLAEHHPDTLQRYGHFMRDRLSSEDV